MPRTAKHHSNHIEIQIHLEQDETKTHRLILQKTGGEQITLPLADLIDLPDKLKKTRYDTQSIPCSNVLIGQGKITQGKTQLGLNHQESNELEQRLRSLLRPAAENQHRWTNEGHSPYHRNGKTVTHQTPR